MANKGIEPLTLYLQSIHSNLIKLICSGAQKNTLRYFYNLLNRVKPVGKYIYFYNLMPVGYYLQFIVFESIWETTGSNWSSTG